LAGRRQLSRLDVQGLIQCFEYTHELAWKTLKDFLEARGVRELYGSRDSTRAAFVANLIESGETWMEMIQGRNLTTYTYNEATAAIQKIRAVLNLYPQVEKAVLYGSRAKGSYKNGSDIDLTLCGGADLTLSVRHRIAAELDDLLLPHTIDLSIFRDIGDPDLIEHIQRVGTTLYARQQQLMEERGPEISTRNSGSR